MDAKYLGKTVPLPKEAADMLLEVQAALTERLGFKPSHSDTVRFVLKHWKDSQPERRVEVLIAATEGVERARTVGYDVSKPSDVAGCVVQALHEKGLIKR